MSEARLLSLVAAYPHRVALARRARDGSVFAGLGRLERLGLVARRRELYRLTKRGADELRMTRALAQTIARAHGRA